jgi:hypothetical protein
MREMIAKGESLISEADLDRMDVAQRRPRRSPSEWNA